jgi:hypothetical protein
MISKLEYAPGPGILFTHLSLGLGPLPTMVYEYDDLCIFFYGL